MAMRTIEGASSTGTQCIFREQVILRARVVSIYSLHLTSLPVAQGMLTIFIATKPSKNILHFGMLITLKSVQLLTAELETIKAELRLSDNNFPRFFDQEHIYLDSLKRPAPRDQLSIHYVEVSAEWDLAFESGNNALMGVHAGSLEQMGAVLKQARIQVDSSYAKLQHAEVLVAYCKGVLSVYERWVIGGEEYNRFKEEATLSKYCAALDELEHLVVMRLFKLSKLLLSGTGLSVPLLDWARPAHREATTKYFRLCRAHEEIIQLNIEIHWLRTAIHDEATEIVDLQWHIITLIPTTAQPDPDALDHEEHKVITENMADCLHSIND
ncbi:hypothetical protein DEU56DRAFT_869443 [Suillus clintonianus]|uniref:uncharacterized protein n=1 Tax=Suillus clintonianus TaxID=1904413 RepID=UPI001B86CD46|nr:uncharacterized protein DEU56DRAFT_869443 [Suillus clintonianus]KAG2149219.1 hypothetical protein DEU56DRAFT_869443 [Suillus clintonianus]